MKKKYIKPEISSFKMPVVNAQGFEIMGLCETGTYVGDTDSGDCQSGTNPTSLNGACNTGSSDGTEGSVCATGNFAGSGCNSGSNPSG